MFLHIARVIDKTNLFSILLFLVTSWFFVNAGEPCTTPNNERAHCVSLFTCPILIKAVSSSEPTVIDFVKKSLCGDGNNTDINVCCGTSGSYSLSLKPPTTPPSVYVNKTEESHRDFVIRKLLPTRVYCGYQHTDDRFYNKSETALDEFPWLAHIKWYNTEDEKDFDERCNGVLISARYVLTDYLCGFHARTVKLGQHSTGASISCVEDPNYPECSEPTVEVDIEEKFQWAKPSRSGDYNFVLIRLARRVDYTDFLRPICLPLGEDVRSQKQETLVFSGWGAPDSKMITKKRLIYNVTDDDVCYKINNFLEGNVKSAKVDLVCLEVTEKSAVLACNGDHGGPLMFSYRHQWFAYGILISVHSDVGSDYCSNERAVNGITITPEIVEWILDKMRA